jgi:hypothetical protein
MKRLGLFLLFLPLYSAAEVVVPIDSVENSVNIRITADAKSEIVGRLNQGDWVELVESIPGWHEVEITGGATGFISADWSRVLDEAPALPAADEEVVAAAEDEVADDIVAEEVIRDTAASEPTVEEPVADVAAEAEPVVVPSADAEAVLADVVDDAENVIVNEAPEPAEVIAAEVVAVSATADVVADVALKAVAPVAEPAPTNVAEEMPLAAEAVPVPVIVATVTAGPVGPPGPPGPPGRATVEGSPDYLMKFTAPTIGGNSQVFDDGNNIGIGTTSPKQRLEVNGNIQIHEQNSSVAGLMITQAGGETGYIMHNRASTLTIGAGSVDRITIDRDGNVGFGVTRPANPIQLASGAHVTAGGVWTNSSSRARKENIADLSSSDALDTLNALEPVQFNYKNDQTESYIGFIAEDVPELVATRDRDGLSAMDIVAVLTKVVQEQQKKIAELEARLDQR